MSTDLLKVFLVARSFGERNSDWSELWRGLNFRLSDLSTKLIVSASPSYRLFLLVAWFVWMVAINVWLRLCGDRMWKLSWNEIGLPWAYVDSGLTSGSSFNCWDDGSWALSSWDGELMSWPAGELISKSDVLEMWVFVYKLVYRWWADTSLARLNVLSTIASCCWFRVLSTAMIGVGLTMIELFRLPLC